MAAESPTGVSVSDEEECKLCSDGAAQSKEDAAQFSSSADAEFRRGLEELVRDHFDSCMALASAHDPGIGSSASSFPNDSGCSQEHPEMELQENREASQGPGGRQSQILSRWYERRAEQVITTMERQARQAELLALAGLHAVSMLDSSFLRDSQPESQNEVERPQQPRRTSPLVQLWRGIEGDRSHANQTSTFQRRERSTVATAQPTHEPNVEASSFETAGEGQAAAEETSQIDETTRASVRQIIDRWMNERITGSSNSDRSQRERNELLDLNERERVRELAREWLRSNTQQRADSEAEPNEDWEAQRRRDRQLILDMLMRTERERQQELEGLSEHRVVSSFPHRGRLQSLLRGRFLVNRIREEEEDNLSSSARELGQLRQRRAVSGLREGFRSRLETIVQGQASVALDASHPQNEETPDESVTRWTERMNSLEENLELRELLGRRSVTNILASEFRDRLDQLIRSFIQRQVPWPGEAAASPAPPPPPPPPPPPLPPLVPAAAQGDQLNNNPPPPPPPPPMQPVWQSDFVPRPAFRNPYVMWDNTSQLRADISRLQQGLGDLQRLVETCVEMQMELQRSIRQEVAGAMQRMYDAGRGCVEAVESDGSQWAAVRKGSCCICCDKSIDSLLYRCGHMCTCLRCAHQLMQTGSKCPMCRAAIVEVIRAFTIA